MNYKWFKIFNLSEFIATGLFSRSIIKAVMEGIGQKDILIARGNEVSLVYEGTFLPIEFENENPYSVDGYAVYKDAENNVWLGIEADA